MKSLMADGGHLRFIATRKVPKLKNNHFRVFGMPIDCPCSSSRARDVKFHIFQNGGSGHFENQTLAELAVTFERSSFSFKNVEVVKSIEKKVGQEWSRN